MAKKVVAIVGRPNVGKSTLFNALSGEKISIVKDVPGVTRDRIYADCEWRGTTFQMIDTGGIEPESEDVILKQMRRQAELAMDIADVIVFITDIKAGVTVSDEEVAQMLRKTRKPVILVCNKSMDIMSKTRRCPLNTIPPPPGNSAGELLIHWKNIPICRRSWTVASLATPTRGNSWGARPVSIASRCRSMSRTTAAVREPDGRCMRQWSSDSEKRASSMSTPASPMPTKRTSFSPTTAYAFMSAWGMPHAPASTAAAINSATGTTSSGWRRWCARIRSLTED